MLDKEDNGFIMNSVHSNNGCYTYTKEIVEGKTQQFYLFVDESRPFPLYTGDCVVVRRSRHAMELARLTEKSFCEIFAQKMLPGGTEE